MSNKITPLHRTYILTVVIGVQDQRTVIEAVLKTERCVRARARARVCVCVCGTIAQLVRDSFYGAKTSGTLQSCKSKSQ